MQSYSRSLLIALCGILLVPIPNRYSPWSFIYLIQKTWYQMNFSSIQIQPPRRNIFPHQWYRSSWETDWIVINNNPEGKTCPEGNMRKYLSKGSSVYFMYAIKEQVHYLLLIFFRWKSKQWFNWENWNKNFQQPLTSTLGTCSIYYTQCVRSDTTLKYNVLLMSTNLHCIFFPFLSLIK